MDTSLLTIIIIAVLLILFFMIFRKPMKIVFKFFLNTLLGFVALLVINFLGGFIGISIGVNLITAAVTGVLGVPGVALLLLLQWLAII